MNHSKIAHYLAMHYATTHAPNTCIAAKYTQTEVETQTEVQTTRIKDKLNQ